MQDSRRHMPRRRLRRPHQQLTSKRHAVPDQAMRLDASRPREVAGMDLRLVADDVKASGGDVTRCQCRNQVVVDYHRAPGHIGAAQ